MCVNKEGGKLTKRRLSSIGILIAMVLLLSYTLNTRAVSGEVQPITDLEDKLDGISEEEKVVLEKLFTITQEMEALERDITLIGEEIADTQNQIDSYEKGIKAKQLDYDTELEVLKGVLISYQKGGPATYLEILLRADNLADFLKSINLLKDISHNIDELLASLEKGREELEVEKAKLEVSVSALEEKKLELIPPLERQRQLKQEQEAYLVSLQQDREHYQQQLEDLVVVWEDCKLLFTELIKEFTRIVEEGYFTAEDLNLNIGFFRMSGTLYEKTFNTVLKEHSDLPETIFHFHEDQVVIEVPQKHLKLIGKFVLEGDTSILFVPTEGSFYDLPLGESSLEELFQNGPLLISFKEMAGDSVSIDFRITSLQTREGCINFEIRPLF